MNGGGDDDFFFNNNNRQRHLTNSSTTSTSSTKTRKTIQCRQCTKSDQYPSQLKRPDEAVHFAIRRRCPNCKQTFSSKSALWNHLHRSACARKPFQCDRCRKRFPERDWLAEHKVWHIEVDSDRYFKWFDLYAYISASTAATTFASAADVRTHILTDHINNRPFKITIKKEDTSNDG